ncbi:MAG: hypothetical protein JSR46_03600 [Verrucomicrobia bacterium]|nr:hypothetical protein [Verrucomicrobiota bacterium]
MQLEQTSQQSTNDPLLADLGGLNIEHKGYSPNPISMLTTLCTNNVSLLPGSLIDMEKQLGSHGFYESSDGSFSYNHATCVPIAYYQYEHSVRHQMWPCEFEVNMDRGGVVTRPDGSLAACIADGAGGGGYFSAFVAQMISEYCLKRFALEPMKFIGDAEADKRTAQKLIVESCAHVGVQSPVGQNNGSSTLLFAECVPIGIRDGKARYRVQVVSLGDCAAIHINCETKKATQLNSIKRELNEQGKPTIMSTGGLIGTHFRAFGFENIDAHLSEASEDDYIVLVTDGFTDNVREGYIEEMVQFVAFNPFFDQSYTDREKYPRDWEQGGNCKLPTMEEISCFLITYGGTLNPIFERPTAAQITKRLANYTSLVTATLKVGQEQLYSKLLEEGKKAQALFGTNQIQEPKPIEEDVNDPKTDDYMIITMSPSCR